MFKALLILHIIAGTLAVLAGTVAVASPKPVRRPSRPPSDGRPARREGAGQDAPREASGTLAVRFHRRAGRVFQLLMGFVLGTAALMTILRFNAYFAGLTAAALMGVFSGERVLGRKNGERARALDWIVTLGILAVAGYLGYLLQTGQVTKNVPVVRALAYGTSAYAFYDVYRFLFPRAWPFRPRLWLYEHIVKMIGGYSGAVAAFSGSVLVMFPPPWRQLWATCAGWILAVGFVVYYARSKA